MQVEMSRTSFAKPHFGFFLIYQKYWYLCFLLDYPDVPQIDITFAINTAATDADKTFEVLRDAVKNIINMHNPDRIRYSIVIYGDSATPVVSFSKDPQDVRKLLKAVDKLPQPSGLPDLKVLLEEAKKVFEKDSGRPKAAKVLVVVTDSKSPSASDDIKEAARPLEDEGITVIAVAVGDEASSKQLEKMTPENQIPVSVDKDEDPGDIGDKIMDKVLEGEYGFETLDSNGLKKSDSERVSRSTWKRS